MSSLIDLFNTFLFEIALNENDLIRAVVSGNRLGLFKIIKISKTQLRDLFKINFTHYEII